MKFETPAPWNSVSSPREVAVQKTEEEKALEKRKVMERLLQLGEAEIRIALDLETLAVSDQEYTRRVFEDRNPFQEAKNLHEADHIDEMVDWLNRIKIERRKQLIKEGRSAKIMRDELIGIAHDFRAFAEEVFRAPPSATEILRTKVPLDQSSPLVQSVFKGRKLSNEEFLHFGYPTRKSSIASIMLWLDTWQAGYERLIQDCYAWARPREEWARGITQLEEKRIERDLLRLQKVYERPSRINYDLRGLRVELSEAIRDWRGISGKEWMEYVNDEA